MLTIEGRDKGLHSNKIGKDATVEIVVAGEVYNVRDHRPGEYCPSFLLLS